MLSGRILQNSREILLYSTLEVFREPYRKALPIREGPRPGLQEWQ